MKPKDERNPSWLIELVVALTAFIVVPGDRSVLRLVDAMTLPPADVLPTDREQEPHVRAGDPHCSCSRCERYIGANDIVHRRYAVKRTFWSHVLVEWRYCDPCMTEAKT